MLCLWDVNSGWTRAELYFDVIPVSTTIWVQWVSVAFVKKNVFLIICLTKQTEKASEEMVIALKRNKTLPPGDENQILHFWIWLF